jgi:hypothetical protein
VTENKDKVTKEIGSKQERNEKKNRKFSEIMNAKKREGKR